MSENRKNNTDKYDVPGKLYTSRPGRTYQKVAVLTVSIVSLPTSDNYYKNARRKFINFLEKDLHAVPYSRDSYTIHTRVGAIQPTIQKIKENLPYDSAVKVWEFGGKFENHQLLTGRIRPASTTASEK